MEEDNKQQTIEHKFAQATTIHGITHIVDKGKPLWLRIAWLLALCAGMGVCVWQIYLRVSSFHDINTIVSRVYENELDFPAVTICNFNRHRASEVTDEDWPHLRFALFADEDYYDSYYDHDQYDDSSFVYSDFFSDNSTFNYTEFSMRSGFVLDDNKMIECKWRGRRCTAQNFTHVFTSYGNCWTFNSGSKLPILKEDQPGSQNGLKMILNIQQEEYTETLTGNIQAGVKVLVHDQADPPLMDALGLAVPPGFYAFMGIRKDVYINLEPPWGHCNRSKALQHYNNYTLSGCFIECRLAHILAACHCRPVRYPGSAEVCSPLEMSTCVKDVLSKFKSGSLGTCSCPVPCNYTTYSTSISYAAAPSLSVADDTNLSFNESLEYQRMNYVVLDIFYEELNFQTTTENKAMTVSSLISDIGGNVGLFLGGSILTFAELIDYILLKCTGICCAKTKRSPKEKDAPLGVNKEKEQLEGYDNPMQLQQY